MATKMNRQSTLNPHAAPFVPSSRSISSNPPAQQAKNLQPITNRQNADVANGYSLPDSISFDFEECDEQRVVENISNMYPDIPIDFIFEFAGAHGYDFDFTVDMLEQFYVPSAVSEMAESSKRSGDESPLAEKEMESPFPK